MYTFKGQVLLFGLFDVNYEIIQITVDHTNPFKYNKRAKSGLRAIWKPFCTVNWTIIVPKPKLPVGLYPCY